jgi:hypothetical protein
MTRGNCDATLRVVRWTVAWTLVAVACHRTPTPCVAHDACGAGLECLANHCVPQGSDPVSPESVRYVLDPSASGVVSTQRPSAGSGLPPIACFGSRVAGAVAWYLDFTPNWPATARVDRAFLVLSPPAAAPLPSPDVQLQTWRVADPWSVADLTWTDQPSREPPRAIGIASSTPPRPARIDVTHIVQYWQHHPRQRHGVSVEAGSGAGHGVGFTTGVGGGNAPQLEVYVTEEQL